MNFLTFLFQITHCIHWKIVKNSNQDHPRAVMIRQVNLTVTTTTTLPTARTTTTIVSPASATFQTPSIAVTASTGTTSAIQTKRATGKRAAKVEVVRFDSVETIFKQSDHDDIVQRAKIKDEIKRYVKYLY